MGKKRLAWILIFIFCFGFCTGGIASKHFFKKEQIKPMQADSEWFEEEKIRQMALEGTSPYILVSWSEQKPCQQYPYVDWNEGTYCCSSD